MRVLLSDNDLGHWSPGHAMEMDSEALALAYAYPQLSAEQTWVRANFVTTLDGAATGDDGRSGSINTGADRDVFALLRALCDVVLVGAGTARAEGYRRAVVRAPWLKLRQGRPAHHRRRRSDGRPHAPTADRVTRHHPGSLGKARVRGGRGLTLLASRRNVRVVVGRGTKRLV